MSPKVDVIMRDFQAVELDEMSRRRSDNHRAIRKYFDSTYDHDSTEIASSVGRTAANRLTDFVWATLFPGDGSWIQTYSKDPSDLQAATESQTIRMLLNNRLARSNFYEEMNKSIRNAILFGRSRLETSYVNGLSFQCIDNKDIFVTEEADESSQRVYSRVFMSILDIVHRFKDVPKSITDKLKNAQMSTSKECVIVGLIPSTDYFFNKPDKKTRYSRVYLLENLKQTLTPMKDEKGCDAFPIMNYRANNGASLANDALSAAVIIEKYELLHLKQTVLSVQGPLSVDAETIRTNAYNFSPGGLTPVVTNNSKPEPIRITQDYRPNDALIQKKSLDVERIFLSDLIIQSQLPNIGSFEAAKAKARLLETVAPLVGDLCSKTSYSLLERVHKLLASHDPEYQTAVKKANAYIFTDGITGMLQKAKKAASLAHFLQTVTPAIQMNPEGAQSINVDKLIASAAIAHDVPEIIRSSAEVQQERQIMAQQAQQTNQLEQGQQQADVQNTQADTQMKLAQAAGDES